jgi:large subunit ribosomal protein L25
MSTELTLNASARAVLGKGASRRLRRHNGEIPAIVYGGKKKPQSLSLIHKDVVKALENEAHYSQVINLNIDGKTESVVLKDLQRHPSKAILLHMDFLRISKATKLTLKVPLQFVNEDICIGVKQEGGIFSRAMSDLEIQCLPGDLPEFLEVDVAMLRLGETLHMSDISLPKGVESVALSYGADYDQPIASVSKARGSSSIESEDSPEIQTSTESSEASDATENQD